MIKGLLTISSEVKEGFVLEKLRELVTDFYELIEFKEDEISFDDVFLAAIDSLGPEVAVPLMKRIHDNMAVDDGTDLASTLRAVNRLIYKTELERQ